MLSCMSLVLEVCLVVSWFDSSPILGDAKGGGGGAWQIRPLVFSTLQRLENYEALRVFRHL